MKLRYWTGSLGLLLASGGIAAQSDTERFIDRLEGSSSAIAMQIWDWAEVGYQEELSSALLAQTLADAGFSIDKGVADIPTAFVASAGSGTPVIALLAEYDALPGITQTASATRDERSDRIAGHACGHHLLGTGSVAAALALKDWLQRTGTQGTVRLYGTPAEEGGSGKVYMVRAGLFDDVDAVLAWHPSSRNSTSVTTSLANRSAKFRFYGRSAHAAAAPEKARSALDGVEAFNYMVNLMREHVPQETRIHYVITEGGKAPNVVPDFAEVFYYVRHPDAENVRQIWERVDAAALGAAAGTGTRVEAEIIHGNLPLLPNRVLANVMHAQLQALGGVSYSAEEQAYAEQIHGSLYQPSLSLGDEQTVMPMKPENNPGSTDVGDVSWTVPTIELETATWVPGTSAHSWQAIAAGGTSIGIKGMQLAAKTMALTAQALYSDPTIVAKAKSELAEARGPDYVYAPLLGDREPPLDYRR